MARNFTKHERASLRQFSHEAWETELTVELETLFEAFCQWADKGMSAFELSDRIHAFHNGASRDLYKRYTVPDPAAAVARAIAIGLIREEELDPSLGEELAPPIEFFRDQANE
jgi:hypothetical protein